MVALADGGSQHGGLSGELLGGLGGVAQASEGQNGNQDLGSWDDSGSGSDGGERGSMSLSLSYSVDEFEQDVSSLSLTTNNKPIGESPRILKKSEASAPSPGGSDKGGLLLPQWSGKTSGESTETSSLRRKFPMLRGISVAKDMRASQDSAQRKSVLNIPVWGPNASSTGDKAKETDIRSNGPDIRSKHPSLRGITVVPEILAEGDCDSPEQSESLNIPVWESSKEARARRKEASPTKSESVVVHTQTAPILNEQWQEDGKNFTARTSTAIAAMIKESRYPSTLSDENGRRGHETARVLDWIARAGSRTLGPRSYSQPEWYSDMLNPALKTGRPDNLKDQQARSHSGPSIPGSVEESVLNLVCEYAVEECSNGREEGGPDSVAADPSQEISRTQAPQSRKNTYRIPDNSNRPLVENICEQAYLRVVRRSCIFTGADTSDLAASLGADKGLVSRVEKELVGAICEIFTDPSIVTTIKTAVLSRVFARRTA